jgi:ribosomal protein S27AE
MKVCSLCNYAVEIDKFFTRKSRCPKCGGDLHICLNCRFYSETSHNKCLEPKAEFQRTRDRANFCDYFLFRESSSVSSGKEKDEAKKRLEDLFRKP